MSIRNLIDRSRNTLSQALAQLGVSGAAPALPLRPPLDLAQLEDRVMLSASPIGDLLMPVEGPPETADEVATIAAPPTETDQATPTSPDQHGWKVETQVELVFVDQGVQDYEQLVVDLLRDADPVRHFEVIMLDENRDGIEQISEVLADYSDLSAIHLVSHGTTGQVNLGNLWLSDLNLNAYAGQIAGWNDSLRDGADLLIYGCDLAATEGGQSLLEALGALCDCDVAASDDDTGHAQYGGDWELEYTTGAIETDIAFSADMRQNWDGLMAVLTVSSGTDSLNGNTSSIAALIGNDGGDGISLREAIIAANNTANSGGPDEIRIDLGGPSLKKITIDSALPTIVDPVIIDATYATPYAGTPVIELKAGALSGGVHGLHFNTTASGTSEVRGLAIYGFTGNGILVQGVGDLLIEGNYIGLQANGVINANTGDGVRIENGTNTIGGLTASTRNVISGNGGHGIQLIGGGAVNNQIFGNYIGLAINGQTLAGNGADGIRLDGAGTNTIGGATVAHRNLISGNAGDGIHLRNGSNTNTITGNYIGTGINGDTDLGNADDGVSLVNSANNTLGGTTAAERNVIAGNNDDGVEITGVGSTGNVIQGNYIGLDAGGTVNLGNNTNGVWVTGGAIGNTVGGMGPGAGNVISGNADEGVEIEGNTTTGNIVQGNFIGTNAAGTASLANGTVVGDAGILLEDSGGNTIGGTAAGARNVIAGNTGSGIIVAGSNATANVIQGNFIGTDLSATINLGNGGSGVLFTNAAEAAVGDPILNIVGGVLAGEANTIAYHAADGITVTAGDRNRLRGNRIFANTELGIDLVGGTENGFGVTVNDLGDGDLGANQLLNYPVLTLVKTNGDEIKVDGSLDSTASTTFDLDFYWSVSADPSGYGEAENYIGSTQVATDLTGNVSFTNLTIAGVVPDGAFVTAIATRDTLLDTSEFGQSIAATGVVGIDLPQGPVYFSADDTATVIDDTALMTNPQASGWNTGRLTIDFTANSTIDDRLGIDSDGGAGEIKVSGTDVQYNFGSGWTTIGSFTGGTDGFTPLVITFNAAADDASVQELIRSITYDNVAGSPSFLTRTVRFVLIDGGGEISNTETEQIFVGPANTAPLMDVRTNPALSYTENGAPVVIDNGLLVTDPDDTSLAAATISVSAGFAVGDELVHNSALAASLGISGDYNTSTGVLTLSGTALIGDYQQVLRTVAFQNVGDDPGNATRTIAFQANDGFDWSPIDTRNVNVTAVNDPPVIDLDADDNVKAGLAYETTWSEAIGPVQIVDVDAITTDPDAPSLTQITATLTNPLDGINEVLAADVSGTGLTANYNSGTGVLTISGVGTVADYQQVLRTVTYDNVAANPNASSQRLINFVANDGTDVSLTATATVFIKKTGGLYLSTDSDVVAGGTPGISNWEDDEILQFGDPSLSFGATTNGTFSSIQAMGNFSGGKNLDAIHFVSRDIEVGGGSFAAIQLNYGDLLLSVKSPDAFTGSDFVTLNVQNDDVFVFRPDVEGDYSNGIFFMLLDDLSQSNNTVAVSMLENDTLVGDVTLEAGSFVYALGSVDRKSIYHFTADDVGEFTTAGTRTLLLDGPDIGIDTNLAGVDIIEETTSVGGVTLTVGQVLLAVESSDLVGDGTPLSVTAFDVFALDVTTTTMGSGTTVATASMFFEGGDVNLNALGEEVGAFSLVGSEAAPYTTTPPPPDSTPPAQVNNTGSTASEGGSDTLATLELRYDDAEQSPANVTYSVISGPLNGQLEFTDAPLTPINSFTQADINTSRVVYVHDGGETTSDGFTFDVDDGLGNTTTGQSFALTVTPLNDPPVMTSSTTPSVAENQTTVLTVTTADPDLPADTINYTITGGVDFGTFILNATTGVLTFSVPPDFESPTDNDTNNVYEVQVTASDGNGGTDVQLISVTVTDANDAPVITSSGSPSVAENQTAVLTVTTSDEDLPADTISYTITGGPDATTFTLNATTGVLTFTAAPDFEAPGDVGGNNVYDVEVTVDDGNGGTDVQLISVTVTDANDAPVITSSGSPSVAENQTAVLTVTATDTDVPADSLTYTITGGADSGAFALNATSGVLTFSLPPDFESPTDAGIDNVYDVQVTANDGNGGSDVQLISVTVTDANDAPVITSSSSTSVAENQTAVLTVTTSDEDVPADTISYTITGGPDSAAFSLNAATGVLTFTAAPDFETPTDAGGNNVYDVQVTANDGNGGSDVQLISVTVTDANDAPVITSSSSTSVAENQTTVLTVTASDADLPADTISYTITGGPDAAAFTLNATSGVLTFTAAPDFEAPSDVGGNNVYDVQVTANDGNGGADVQLISVTVTDANDAPVITSSSSTSVAENQTAVLTVTATDADLPADTISYTITGGPDAAAFTLNATSGVLTFTAAPDFEAPSDVGGNNVYDVQVTANDGNGGTDVQLISVTVTDANDAPVITSSSSTSVAENQTAVLTVTTTDADLPADTISYTITGGPDAAAFTLNATSGVLTFTAAPDFEAPTDVGGNNVYDVEVTVDDGSGGTDVQLISVTVTDANDAPVITSSSSTSVAENQTAVLTVTASDEDLPADTISYTITGGPDSANFTLNATSGVLMFTSAADFETPTDVGGNNVYDVQVTANDGNGGSDVQLISVTVTDANDAPVITSSSSTSVAENQTAVLTVTTSDEDLPADTINYTITGGPDSATFTLNATTGVLIFTAAPNFEVPTDVGGNNVYDVQVTANDGSGGTDVQLISVTVTDIVEVGSPPVITSSSLVNVAENTAAVATVTATDPDGDPVTFNISGGADQGSFSIQAATGMLTLIAAPDFELPTDADTDNVYEVEVTAADGNGGTDVQTISVTVTAVNDNLPVFTSSSTPAVVENQTIVQTLAATDADSPTQAVSFAISGGADAARFTINGAGELIFVAAPDFEAPSDANTDNLYEVQVTADDGKGGTTLQSISVTVAAVNDNLPVFTSSSTPSLAEDQTIVQTLTATDADLPTQTIGFAISGGVDAALFTINGARELVFVAAPDFEAPGDANTDNLYEVQVTADDGNGGTTLQSINVTVTNGNETPLITSPTTASVSEHTTSVAVITATDPDSDPLVFSVTGGSDAALFAVNATTGALSFVAAPNFEVPSDANGDNVYQVDVTADDGNGGSVLQTISVSVTDANDAPVSSDLGYAMNADSILTVAAAGVLAGSVDEDGDPLTASLVAGPAVGTLTLNSDGSFSFAPPKAFAGSVQFSFSAADGISTGNVATVTIVVNSVLAPPPATAPPPADVPAEEESPVEVVTPPPPLAPPAPTPPQHEPAPVAGPVPETETEPGGILTVQTEADLSGLEHEPFVYEATGGVTRTLSAVVRTTNAQTSESLREGLAFVLDTLVWQDLDELRQQVDSRTAATPVVAGTTAGVSSVVTAGYVMWTIRGGWLVSSLLAQMPAWQLVDPLLILDSLQEEDLLDDEQREEDQQVEEMFEESADARG